MSQRSSRVVWQVIVSIVLPPALYFVLLFGPAGTLTWWRGWVLVGVIAVASVVSIALVFPGNEGLVAERFKLPVQAGQPHADRVLVPWLLASYFVSVAFVPFDVFDLHLFRLPDPLVSVAGLALFVVGWLLTALALRANHYAALVVRHQSERGQHVVDTGLYAVVRHPMYVGAILLFVGLPLWLGSWAGALVTLVPVAILARRIGIEERFLRETLPGYSAYTERVRYRLIPYVW
ncbi:MAG TPA: isoprenylcysteine carboxylmethyltransferase family protein [Candidatus Bathyarchaeia archaeon]|nr:isoprenylcysteine carboxylmethyltransferase family protein [Candidatus Bathyarchaeia archaeon]